jgi:hypothetical protein
VQKNHWRLLILTMLLSVTLLFGAQETRSSKSGGNTVKAQHPAIEAMQVCSDCHPAEDREWAASKHGQDLVKCLVCHGSVQENFIAKPAVDRCLACHGEIVRGLAAAARTKGKGCFQCHAPHSLDPHVLQTGAHQ